MEATDQLDVFKSIFSTSRAFVYRCHNDKDFTMQFMSGQVKAITGYDIQEIEGNASVSFVGITHPEDQEMMFAAVDAAIERKEPWNVAYRLVRKNGDAVHIREFGSAVFDAAGELQFLQGLIFDATTEVDLRREIEVGLNTEREANAEILAAAANLTNTLKTLSFVASNARIEAARVGTHGKGFAVIASDMGALVQDNTKILEVLEDKIRSRGKAA